MIERENTEATRLVYARNTLKIVWAAYRDNIGYVAYRDIDVRVALEVALDEIDLALLRLDDVDLTFDYRDGNENDSQ